MTYEERRTAVCSKCPDRCKETSCGYVMFNLQNECPYLNNVMSGWELGQQDTIEEIEKYIGNNDSLEAEFIRDYIEQLKKGE